MQKQNMINKIRNVDFELTYRCNLKCIHCYNPPDQGKEKLTTPEILKTIYDLCAFGFKEIHITGGEPFMHPDLIQILTYANNLGVKVLLETNGTLLLDIEKLSKLKNLTLRTSIDGPEKIHNQIRESKLVNNPFQKTIKNSVHAIRNGIKVQITISVNKLNHPYIKKLVSELIQKKLLNIRLRLSMPASRAKINWQNLALSKNDFQALKAHIKDLKKDFPEANIQLNTLYRNNPRHNPKFFIDPFGNVKPYPFIEFYVGNVTKETIM